MPPGPATLTLRSAEPDQLISTNHRCATGFTRAECHECSIKLNSEDIRHVQVPIRHRQVGEQWIVEASFAVGRQVHQAVFGCFGQDQTSRRFAFDIADATQQLRNATDFVQYAVEMAAAIADYQRVGEIAPGALLAQSQQTAGGCGPDFQSLGQVVRPVEQGVEGHGVSWTVRHDDHMPGAVEVLGDGPQEHLVQILQQAIRVLGESIERLVVAHGAGGGLQAQIPPVQQSLQPCRTYRQLPEVETRRRHDKHIATIDAG